MQNQYVFYKAHKAKDLSKRLTIQGKLFDFEILRDKQGKEFYKITEY